MDRPTELHAMCCMVSMHRRTFLSLKANTSALMHFLLQTYSPTYNYATPCIDQLLYDYAITILYYYNYTIFV